MTIAASGLVARVPREHVGELERAALRLRARLHAGRRCLHGIVGVCLLTAWIYRAVLRRGSLRIPGTSRMLSPSRSCLAAAAVGTLVLMTGVVVARTYGLPRIDSRHLATLEYSATCAPDTCRVAIAATNDRGESVDLPTTSTPDVRLRLGRAARFTVHAPDPADGVAIPATCADPRLVAAWPTIMGVPPSSDVLRAVGVSNA